MITDSHVGVYDLYQKKKEKTLNNKEKENGQKDDIIKKE